jgi:hypothetical protein
MAQLNKNLCDFREISHWNSPFLANHWAPLSVEFAAMKSSCQDLWVDPVNICNLTDCKAISHAQLRSKTCSTTVICPLT